MITNLTKLDADMDKFREQQLDKYLSEPPVEDTERCAICGEFFAKDDMVRNEENYFECADCMEGDEENGKG